MLVMLVFRGIATTNQIMYGILGAREMIPDHVALICDDSSCDMGIAQTLVSNKRAHLPNQDAQRMMSPGSYSPQSVVRDVTAMVLASINHDSSRNSQSQNGQ
jgi:hypothetical protein